MLIEVMEVKRGGIKQRVQKEVADDYFDNKVTVEDDSNIALLKESKADKSDIEAMWQEMAHAYSSGVNSI